MGAGRPTTQAWEATSVWLGPRGSRKLRKGFLQELGHDQTCISKRTFWLQSVGGDHGGHRNPGWGGEWTRETSWLWVE